MTEKGTSKKEGITARGHHQTTGHPGTHLIMRANTSILCSSLRCPHMLPPPTIGASCYSSMHTFVNAVRTGEAREAEEGETGRAAAFINREIDGDVSSSAAGSRRGKKRRSREELAGCPMHRIDDEQHVDTVSPFIPRYQENKNHYSC